MTPGIYNNPKTDWVIVHFCLRTNRRGASSLLRDLEPQLTDVPGNYSLLRAFYGPRNSPWKTVMFNSVELTDQTSPLKLPG